MTVATRSVTSVTVGDETLGYCLSASSEFALVGGEMRGSPEKEIGEEIGLTIGGDFT